jgi:predicted transcriptional regulator
MKRIEYDVFTQLKRGENLIHIGTVEAESVELAKVYASYVYDEEDWAGMCVVARDQINWVKKVEGLFEKEGADIRG